MSQIHLTEKSMIHLQHYNDYSTVLLAGSLAVLWLEYMFQLFYLTCYRKVKENCSYLFIGPIFEEVRVVLKCLKNIVYKGEEIRSKSIKPLPTVMGSPIRVLE
jgi:hypothetical protein